MAHAVFIPNPTSIYDDDPGVHYHFPRRSLRKVEETVGDWVVFYQGRRGADGYTHVQRVTGVRPDPVRPDHFHADLSLGDMLGLESVVPRLGPDGRPFETRLPPTGGLNASAVRRLRPDEFAAIVNEGLREVVDADAQPRVGPLNPAHRSLAAVADGQKQAEFGVDRRAILTSRPARDATFGRIVRRGYGGRCSISGLRLRNGGGRAEVQACHIRSVADGGPDIGSNGIALSGTLHWMFDRGLIRIADDYSLIISHNRVDLETVGRLVNAERRLMIDEVDPRHRPHPAFLKFHREKDYA